MDLNLSKLEAEAGLSIFLRRLLINELLNDLIKPCEAKVASCSHFPIGSPQNLRPLKSSSEIVFIGTFIGSLPFNPNPRFFIHVYGSKAVL